jgi:peptidyl-prolyl cis-trans isomerase SurA
MLLRRVLIVRVAGALAAVAVAALAAAASAQTSPPARAAAPAAAPANSGVSRAPIRTLDRVVAVVNDEALTQWDVNEQRRVVLQQMKASNVQPPSADVLDKQLLERLINERALLQHAKDNGIRVDDTTVERTILRVAEENKLTPDEFRKALDKEGISYAQYRDDIRRQLLIQRVREREVDSKLSVSEAEVDNYLATVAAQAGGENEYLLSHIYVSLPEQATAEQIEQRRRRAEAALAEVKQGKEFGQVAASYSDAPDALTGGSLGWRTPARLPSVFSDYVRNLKKGDVSQVLRSPGGFHIVKLDDQRSRNQPMVVDQTRARHILIKVNETTSEVDAKARIDRLRDRLLGGAKFEELARVNSEDATSAKGGDLGWLSPGDTVPEFEKTMEKLKPDELSQPVRTPFGWHLIQVLERRKQDITEARRRDQARSALRERKSDEQFADFLRQLRDRTYVEYKTDEK